MSLALRGWLTPGPDTMPNADRYRLGLLRSFHACRRAWARFPLTRSEWLDLDASKRFHWTMKAHFNPDRLERLATTEHGFWKVIPRGAA